MRELMQFYIAGEMEEMGAPWPFAQQAQAPCGAQHFKAALKALKDCHSGNGREWGAHGIDEFLETKSVYGFEKKQAR